MSEIEWKMTEYHTGMVSIEGYNLPKYSKVVLLDDIEKMMYRPMGWDTHGKLLFWPLPYPISHACAVEEEKKTWLRRVQCPNCGKGMLAVGVPEGAEPPLCRKCQGD